MRVVITYQHREDETYLSLIERAFMSATRLGYETVLVSSMEEPLHDRLRACADYYLDVPVSEEPKLMNWILAAQKKFIDSWLFDCPALLFSPDALIIKGLRPVYDMDFDVAFTDRPNSRWPINNGVIFLKGTAKEALSRFWKEAIDLCKCYNEETQNWYGDQLSLWDLVRTGACERLKLKHIMLPCHTYNASPGNDSEIDTDILKRAYILHLKGKRKHMMERYAEICIS